MKTALEMFEDIAYRMSELMNYIGDSDPDVWEGIADSLDKLLDAKDYYERGIER